MTEADRLAPLQSPGPPFSRESFLSAGVGRLVLVANRQLPYEAVLQAGFSSWSEIARDGSFKVLLARR